MDAERRCGLADDADDHESADGWTCASRGSVAGVSCYPAGGRACGHGGPAALSFADARMDGARFSDSRHHDTDQLRGALGTALVYVPAGAGFGDE